MVLELKQCCDARLGQKLLRDPEALLDTETEQDLLKRMKKIAVITKNHNAHHSEFGKMRQERGELFLNWVGRLREKAALCQFVQTGCHVTNCPCTHDHPLDEIQINDSMIDHMYTQDHRTRILASPYADTYEKCLERARKLEEVDSTSETVQPSDKPSTTDIRNESDYRKQEGAKRPSSAAGH